MGNKITNIDKYATQYILNSTYQNLLDLQDESNCKKLRLIFEEIIKKHFTPKEIVFLKFRIKCSDNILTRADFIFLDSQDISKHNIEKNLICSDISNFYI